LREHFSETYWG